MTKLLSCKNPDPVSLIDYSLMKIFNRHVIQHTIKDYKFLEKYGFFMHRFIGNEVWGKQTKVPLSIKIKKPHIHLIKFVYGNVKISSWYVKKNKIKSDLNVNYAWVNCRTEIQQLMVEFPINLSYIAEMNKSFKGTLTNLFQVCLSPNKIKEFNFDLECELFKYM
jgi:hypothetical protein